MWNEIDEIPKFDLIKLGYQIWIYQHAKRHRDRKKILGALDAKSSFIVWNNIGPIFLRRAGRGGDELWLWVPLIVDTHGPMNLKWVLLKPVYSRAIDVQTPAKSQPTLLIKLSQNYPIARNVTSLGWTVSWNNANSAQLYWFLGLAWQIKLSWGLVGGGWQAGNNQVQNKSQFRWIRLNQPTGTKLGKMEICFRQTSHFERINRFWKQIGLYTQLRISIRFNNMYSIGWGGTVPNQRVKLS